MSCMPGPKVHSRNRSLSSPTTSWPAPSSMGTITVPMYPLWPVTRMRMSWMSSAAKRKCGRCVRQISELQRDLPTVKRFRIPRGGFGLDPANPQERQERIRCEPVLVLLTLEALHEHGDLLLTGRLVEMHEDIRGAQVAVVLQNLVLEDHLVTKGVPRHLRHEPMILVKVVAEVREHEVGLDSHLELFEECLDLLTNVREEAVLEVLDHDVLAP